MRIELSVRDQLISTYGKQLAKLGDKADPNSDSIALDGEPLGAAAEPMVLLLNKPAGVLSSLGAA